MKKDKRPKICNLLFRKWLTAFFICILPLFAGRSNGQDRDVFQRKDLLVEMSQSEREKHIQSLLISDSPNDQAWGAYWASKYGMAEFAPQMSRLVDSTQSKKPEVCRFRDLAMLDSLIKLNASVSSEQLMPLYKQYPDHVLILLAKSPKENYQALFEVAKAESRENIYWMTACNLLEKSKAPGFAAFLLKAIRIEVDVDVGNGILGSTLIDDFPSSAPALPPAPFVSLDLPPIDNYRLTKIQNETSIVVAPGNVTIFYMKKACYPGPGNPRIGKDGMIKENPGSILRRTPIDYLTDLLDYSLAKNTYKIHYFFRIYWKSPEQFSEEIGRICDEVHSPFKSVLDNLIKSQWLAKTEAKDTGINVEFKVNDFRSDKSVAFPPIPSWCGRIKASE